MVVAYSVSIWSRPLYGAARVDAFHVAGEHLCDGALVSGSGDDGPDVQLRATAILSVKALSSLERYL